jgi:hypothetical protein
MDMVLSVYEHGYVKYTLLSMRCLKKQAILHGIASGASMYKNQQ